MKQEYRIPSQSDMSVMYTVTSHDDGRWVCNCNGYKYNKKCKHIDSAKNESVQKEFQKSHQLPGDIINQPTPKKFLEDRKGRGGMTLTYVKGGYVNMVLNKAFGIGGWSFAIEDYQIGNTHIFVKGRLTIDDAHYENFGGQEIKKYKDGKAIDIGDDLKGATTDALKKCASMIGVANDVYFPDAHV